MESPLCDPQKCSLDANYTSSDMVDKIKYEECLATLMFDKITAKTYSIIESNTFDRAMYDSYSLESTSSAIHNLSHLTLSL